MRTEPGGRQCLDPSRSFLVQSWDKRNGEFDWHEVINVQQHGLARHGNKYMEELIYYHPFFGKGVEERNLLQEKGNWKWFQRKQLLNYGSEIKCAASYDRGRISIFQVKHSHNIWGPILWHLPKMAVAYKARISVVIIHCWDFIFIFSQMRNMFWYFSEQTAKRSPALQFPICDVKELNHLYYGVFFILETATCTSAALCLSVSGPMDNSQINSPALSHPLWKLPNIHSSHPRPPSPVQPASSVSESQNVFLVPCSIIKSITPECTYIRNK